MRVPLIVPVAVGTFFGAISTRLPVGDSDVYWHLVLGRDTLAHGLQRTDSYAWTISGQATSIDQWLGQVALAAVWMAADWRGIVALRAAAIAALIAIVLYGALRERPSRPLVAVVAALPAIILTRFVWTERPELFGFVCFAALIVLLRTERGLYAAPALIVLWANVHGSFALGAVLTVMVALERAVAVPALRTKYAAVALGSVVATLLTPAGLGTWTAPGFHLLHPPREIQEWSVPDVTTLPGAIFLLAVVTTFVVAWSTRTSTLRDGIVLVPVLFVSLIATRQLPLYAIAAAPYLAAHGGESLSAMTAAARLRLPHLSSAARVPGRAADGLVCAIAVVTLAIAAVTGVSTPDLGGYPAAAVPALRTGPGLLNQYDWGGYLIGNAPRTPVFVDGRLTPYLGGVLSEYTTVLGVHPGWREVIARRGITQLLVRPTDPVAVRARDLGWVIRASSDTFVLIDVP